MKSIKNIIIIIIAMASLYFIFQHKSNVKPAWTQPRVDLSETTDVAVILRFYKKYGIEMGRDYANASDMYKIVGQAANDFQFYPNNGKNIPKENDIIVWWTKDTADGAPGHVGIIAEVEFSKETNIGTVWTVEQGRAGNSNLFSYLLTRHDDGTYHVTGFDNLEVKGWNHPLRADLQVEPTYK